MFTKRFADDKSVNYLIAWVEFSCWARQPNGIGKEGPNSGQKKATGAGVPGWTGRAGVFPGHVAFLWTEFEQMVKPIAGLWFYTIFTTGFEKSNQVTVFGRRCLGNEFYKDIEYDEWFFGKDSRMFLQNPL